MRRFYFQGQVKIDTVIKIENELFNHIINVVKIKKGEAWLVGVHISPMKTTSKHTKTDPTRHRKLLLNRKELDRLIGSVERRGFSLIPLKLYWKRGKVKIEIGLGKGKQKHDKRQSIKERDWSRQKSRISKKI